MDRIDRIYRMTLFNDTRPSAVELVDPVPGKRARWGVGMDRIDRIYRMIAARLLRQSCTDP
jgi:hypothetical protein